MMKTQKFPIAHIYVPVKRRATLEPNKVDEIAESILEKGQETPIYVRADGDRYVLVEGLHRLEACRKLGEAEPSSVISCRRDGIDFDSNRITNSNKHAMRARMTARSANAITIPYLDVAMRLSSDDNYGKLHRKTLAIIEEKQRLTH